MIVIGLDLSFHCSGIAVYDTDTKIIKVGICSSKHYVFQKQRTKYATAFINSDSIGNYLVWLLCKYRHQQIQIVIESMAYGLKNKFGSSDNDLLILQGSVLKALRPLTKCVPEFVMPKMHKKAFTGNGKASKQDSINALLARQPLYSKHIDKLDDVADAVALIASQIDINGAEFQLL